MSRGVPTRTQSAAAGAISWGTVFALSFWLQNDGREETDHRFSNNRDAALAGAAFGAGIGLISGALHPRERWHRVRLPVRVAVAPAPGGGDGWVVAVER